MAKLEQSIKDILKRKGLTLTDLANRIGSTPSNLLQSIKRNPKMERVQEIARALNTTVAEILDEPPTGALGFTVIGGQFYQLNRPAESMAQIPVYGRYDTLSEEIKVFVERAVNAEKPISIMGVIETYEYFSLVYEPKSSIFLLSLCFENKRIETKKKKKKEYLARREEGRKKNVKWSIEAVVDGIIGDLDGHDL